MTPAAEQRRSGTALRKQSRTGDITNASREGPTVAPKYEVETCNIFSRVSERICCTSSSWASFSVAMAASCSSFFVFSA